MKKTAKQLAEELGVSATTVSMALRGNGNISAATKEKILAAAREAGMTIPSAAESKPEVWRDFALICSDYVEYNARSPYPNPYVFGMIRDLGKVCAEKNARLMTTFSYPSDPDKAPFDGYFVYAGTPFGIAEIQTQKPVVYIDAEPSEKDSVAFDQEGSMKLLAHLIAERGYKRPFFMFFDHIHPKFERSWLLLDFYLRQKGIQMETVKYNENGEILGNEVDQQWNCIRECAKMLAERKNKNTENFPDVILCSNDCFAGMMQLELKKLGIASGKINDPKVIPLIGFDDIPYVPGAGLFTTFRTDTKILADAAFNLMSELIKKRSDYIRHLKVEPKLILR